MMISYHETIVSLPETIVSGASFVFAKADAVIPKSYAVSMGNEAVRGGQDGLMALSKAVLFLPDATGFNNHKAMHPNNMPWWLYLLAAEVSHLSHHAGEEARVGFVGVADTGKLTPHSSHRLLHARVGEVALVFYLAYRAP